MKKAFWKFLFKIAGWKIEGQNPDLKKYVIIIAPHTSYWDFFIGYITRNILGFSADFLVKDQMFKYPIISTFLHSRGAHPVDRTKNNSVVDRVVELFNEKEAFIFTVTPEGTRSYVDRWKSGFYRIAVKAKVPIVTVGFDFENKTVIFKEPYWPKDDWESDSEVFLSFYRKIKGKHPEKGIK
jgi:1-acyl-sn-glycerol-3-phosphate acyltransferase